MTAHTDRLKVMLKPMWGSSDLAPMLCDADGNPLPGQVSISIDAAVDDIASVTVKFAALEFANPGRLAVVEEGCRGWLAHNTKCCACFTGVAETPRRKRRWWHRG